MSLEAKLIGEVALHLADLAASLETSVRTKEELQETIKELKHAEGALQAIRVSVNAQLALRR